MIHVTCRLTAKNRDQLRNPTLSVIDYGLHFFIAHMGELCCAKTEEPIEVAFREQTQVVPGNLYYMAVQSCPNA